MLSYVLKDLVRNPRRTVAAFLGVALAVGLVSGIAFFVDSSSGQMTARALAPVSIDMQAGIRTPLSTTLQGNAGGVTVDQLLSSIRGINGIAVAEPLGLADLPAGALGSGGTVLPHPVKVLGVSRALFERFHVLKGDARGLGSGGALLSQQAADLLAPAAGATLRLSIPGASAPLDMSFGGVADLSAATPLFASRNPDTQGETLAAPYVVVVDYATFASTVVPALRVDAAAATPVVQTPPILEVEVGLDRPALSGDPAAALVRAQGLRRTVERTSPGNIVAIDNVSDTLTSARTSTTLAKVLFIFLGLPGVLLAAYLSRYAGSLLAESQRRERAILRARGIRPAALVRMLAYNSVAVAAAGGVAGLTLGGIAMFLLFGGGGPLLTNPAALLASVGIALATAVLTTVLALYLPARRALAHEVAEGRREVEAGHAPGWLRVRLDLVMLAVAALVGGITFLSGGYRPTAVEGQSVSLSFYVLLAPLCFWLGGTLVLVRLLLVVARRAAPTGSSSRVGRGPALGALALSLRRRPQAVASGVVALALSVAFGTSLAIFVGTYQAEKLADARFVVGGDVRITPAAGAAAATRDQLAVPGVTQVTAVAQATALVGSDRRPVAAIDPVGYARVADFRPAFFQGTTPDAALATLRTDPTAVLLDVEMAKAFNIQVGDPVRVQLTDRVSGKQVPVTYRASALFIHFPGFPQGIDMVTSLAGYQASTHDTSPAFYLLRTAGTDAANAGVAAALQAGAGHGGQLAIDTTGKAFNIDQSSLAALNLNGLGRLESAYTVLMSSLGIAIFVFGLLLQRRKEHVTMRALGMRMRQLQVLVLGEAGLVAGLSLAIGGVVGLGMALMFVQILTPLFTVPPAGVTLPVLQLAVLAVLVICAMAISSLAAGASLRRQRLVELLREE